MYSSVTNKPEVVLDCCSQANALIEPWQKDDHFRKARLWGLIVL
jgi:hypothetical protein